MNICIETQQLCCKEDDLRGIPYYLKNLINALLEKKCNDYSFSFFDYNRERGNKDIFLSNIGRRLPEGVLKENNSISYVDIRESILSDDFSKIKNYSEYFGDEVEIYHSPYLLWLPPKVDKRIVVTMHDILPISEAYHHYWPKHEQIGFSKIIQYLKTREDCLFAADSENTKNDLVNCCGINPDRVFVTLLGVDHSFYRHDVCKDVLERYGIRNPYILYLGALDSRKGIDTILKAFDICKEKNSDVQLILAGAVNKWYKGMWKEVYSEAKHKESIILTGHVSDIEKRQLMSNAEVFLFPSEYEGFGLPVLEAMACGCPVITTNVSSLPEVGGDATLYITPGNVEALVYEVDKVLNYSGTRNSMIEKGYERAKLFTWDACARKTEKIYKALR